MSSDLQVTLPRPMTLRRTLPAIVAMAVALAALPFTATTYWPIFKSLGFLEWRDFWAICNRYPSDIVITAMVAIIYLFDKPRRRCIVYLLVALGVSGAMNETIKQTFGRYRPEAALNIEEKAEKDLKKILAADPASPIRIAREDQWLFMKPGRPFFEDYFSSFPSGHANAAFVLAAFLTALYWRGRLVWFVFSVGVALARIETNRHFPEDVLYGAGQGWLIAQWVMSWHWPGRIGDWIVARLERFRWLA
ncbi:MAG: phosphatase PAP2 family protein [Candidatus Sumerlaeaceae bacterium]|nr:phosphatase PAP2 family protein [Candidatus Sumerlaeaceae bacterium]